MTDVAETDEATAPAIVPGSVAIMYCTRGEVRFEFAQSLVGMVTNPLEGHRIKYVLGRIASGNLAVHRNEVVQDFLNTDAEWLWLVDDDEQFPPETLGQLFEVLDNVADLRVVGGLYSNVGLDGGIIPMAYFVNDLNRVQNYSPANIAGMIAEGTKSIKVHGSGAGCLLIHRDVLLEMYEKNPGPMAWFANDIIPDANGIEVVRGEDFSFFRRLAEQGDEFQVRIDTDITHFKIQAVTNQHLALQAAREAPEKDGPTQ